MSTSAIEGLQPRVDLLAGIPLFEGVPHSELEEIAAQFKETTLDKGVVVLRQGERGDRFYLLVRGELEVRREVDGEDRLVDHIEAGEIFGEMALLLDEPRNATVRVSRTARLIWLDKASFDRWILSNSKVLERLSRTLASRLATQARQADVRRDHRTILVTSEDGVPGRSLVARTLAMMLRSVAGQEVALLRLLGGKARGKSSRPRLGKSGVEKTLSSLRPDDAFGAELELEFTPDSLEKSNESLSALLEELEKRFDVVLFDLADNRVREAFESVSATAIDLVVEAHEGRPSSDRAARYEVVNLKHPSSRPIPVNHCFPFVLRHDASIESLDVAEAARHLVTHPNNALSITLQRLTRKILGATVGIALGGGAAFGISHVGVLRVLEEEGIPVDIVAGTSMGSIVGAGYASGIPASRLTELATRMGSWRNTLYAVLDFTLTRPALLSGEHMADVFDVVEGRADTFEQLYRPYRAIGADVETGERVSMGTGDIMTAARASAAVPIIWSPVRWQDRILIDGSMVDPVPGEVVRDMGADLIIAVNVVPPLRRGVETVISRWSRRLNQFNPLNRLGDAQGMPNMLDIFMNTIQMMQRELGDYRAIAADVRISPDLSDFTWVEFYRPREITERGAEAARRAVPEIRRLYRDRIAARVQRT